MMTTTTPSRLNKRYPLMNGTVTHEWTVVCDASHRSYVKDKLYKKTILPLVWRSLKILLPRNLRTDRALPSCTFSHLSARDICIRQKNTYFPYRGLGGGGYRPMLYIFGKLLSSQCYAPFDTLRLTVF